MQGYLILSPQGVNDYHCILARGFDPEDWSELEGGGWWSSGASFVVLTSLKDGSFHRVTGPDETVTMCTWLRRPRTFAYVTDEDPGILKVVEVEGLED